MLQYLHYALQSKLRNRRGVTMIEYVLIAAITCVVLVGLAAALRTNITNIWTAIRDALA